MRSTASSSTPYSRVETIDWNQKRSDSPADSENKINGPSSTTDALQSPVDVGLVLKLQQKLKDLEKENGRLIRMVEDLERESGPECDGSTRTHDSFKVCI